MLNLQESFSLLPGNAKDALVNFYGSPEKVMEYFAARFGTYATEIMDSIHKRNSQLGPKDPIIGVNVASGKIHFDYIEEFYAFPWDNGHPRPGGHMEALKVLKATDDEYGDVGPEMRDLDKANQFALPTAASAKSKNLNIPCAC